ncbi:hypothetical protein BH18THE2_BH18THE2_21500 [soil metagenome]
MVVDHKPDIVLTLSNGLEQGGYDVDTYNDIILALSNFKPDIYDVKLKCLLLRDLNYIENKRYRLKC